MDKSYIGLFKSGDDIWSTQYDGIDDMTVKYIVANRYKRRDL